MMGFFSLRYRVQTGSGTHPVSYAVGTLTLSPKVKRRRVKLTALHHVPSLRMLEAVPSLPQNVVMAWCLIKQNIRIHGVMLS
jgi:hypothetical protein